MTTNYPPGHVAGTYASMQKLKSASTANSSKGSEKGDDFASILENAVNETKEAGHRAENSGLQMSNGYPVDIVEAATAMDEIGFRLEALTSLRDRIVDAYEKVMGMPV